MTTGIEPDGAGPGAELGDRLAGGVAGELLDVDGVEDLEADRVAHRVEAGLHAGVAVGDGADAQQQPHDLVVGEQAVAVGDEHPLARVGVARPTPGRSPPPAERAASSMRRSSSTLSALATSSGKRSTVLLRCRRPCG